MSAFLARRAVAAPRFARAFSGTPARPVAKITIVGNLASTPELQSTAAGREVVRYTVASNYGRGENAKTSWFRVTSFEKEGRHRDYIQTIPKGSLVYCEGDAIMSTYKDREGNNKVTLNITQRTLEVLRKGTPSTDDPSSEDSDS